MKQETGKKGTTTDYLARQYIGSLGTVERGIVSVSAVGVLDTISFPLRFEIFKPSQTLKDTDHYQSKPTIAANLVRQIVADGFALSCVVADSLYGESGHFIQTLSDLDLPYVVAIRENHSGFLAPGQRIRWTKWLPFQRILSDGNQEQRFIRECIFGKGRSVRFYEITSDPQQLPKATTRFVMSNLTGNLRQRLGNDYGLRTGIE
jgi:SRSO17 transposase